MQEKKKIRHLPTSLSPANTLKNLDSFRTAWESGTAKTKKKKERKDKTGFPPPQISFQFGATSFDQIQIHRFYKTWSCATPYLGHPARRRCGPVSRGHPQAAQPPSPGGGARPSTRVASSAPPAGVTRGHSAALPSPSFSVGARPYVGPRDKQQKAGRWVRE